MKFSQLVPELTVIDLNKSLSFYQSLLGFKLEYQREENKFAFISLGEAQLMLEEKNGHWVTGILDFPFGRGINLQIFVENIDLIVERLNNAGYKLFRELKAVEYKVNNEQLSLLEFLVQDFDGYLIRFSEKMVNK